METQIRENCPEIKIQPVDKSKFANMSADEKVDYVKDLVIMYPQIKLGFEVLENCMNSWGKKSEPECGCILGDSRVGKTTIAKEFLRKYPDYDEPGGVVKPILYSSIPCPAHIGPMISQLNYDMKDPFWNKAYRNIGILTLRLYELLKKCRVKLIIVEEVQQLVDQDRKKLIRESSDWFKDLINKTKIPVVFLGLPDSTKIFIENEQLGGRVLSRMELKPFQFGDKGFRAFLYVFDTQLPFQKTSGLAQSDVWERIYIATKGYAGFINALLAESTKIALDHKINFINLPVLAHAFNNKLSSHGPNPFVPGFDLENAIKRIKKKFS